MRGFKCSAAQMLCNGWMEPMSKRLELGPLGLELGQKRKPILPAQVWPSEIASTLSGRWFFSFCPRLFPQIYSLQGTLAPVYRRSCRIPPRPKWIEWCQHSRWNQITPTRPPPALRTKLPQRREAQLGGQTQPRCGKTKSNNNNNLFNDGLPRGKAALCK